MLGAVEFRPNPGRGELPPFSLTPALSRWERERRTPRWVGANVRGVTPRLRGCSLSQRERVRVRVNGRKFYRRSMVVGMSGARRWLLYSVLMISAILASGANPAALKPDRVDAAVGRAVAFLVSAQDRDGSINESDKRHNYNYPMTALGIMALAAVGHQPTDKTPEGLALRRALDFLLRPVADGSDRAPYPGYLGGGDASRMYGHGITTLALTEMLGMGVDKQQDALLRDRCQRAVELILRSQRSKKFDPRYAGGWRYTPESPDADLSISVWQVMALRSAKNAGLAVPKEAIDGAVAFLKRSYDSPRDAAGRVTNLKSGCGYTPGQPTHFAMAAAGLLALQVCGQYDAPEALGSANWLRERRLSYDEKWFFYGTYYYAQGMQKRGGDFAAIARQSTEEILLERQNPDGSWLGNDGQERGMAGKAYCTSLAVLSLSVKYHYLPIYQD